VTCSIDSNPQCYRANMRVTLVGVAAQVIIGVIGKSPDSANASRLAAGAQAGKNHIRSVFLLFC